MLWCLSQQVFLLLFQSQAQELGFCFVTVGVSAAERLRARRSFSPVWLRQAAHYPPILHQPPLPSGSEQIYQSWAVCSDRLILILFLAHCLAFEDGICHFATSSLMARMASSLEGIT